MYGIVKFCLAAILASVVWYEATAQDDQKVYQDAMRFMEQGEYDLAMEAFQYIRHIPNVDFHVEACSLLSKRYRNTPLSNYEQYSSEKGDSPEYNYWLGKIYLRKMYRQQAEQAFGTFLELATGKKPFDRQVKEVRSIYSHLQKWSQSVSILPLESPVNTIHCEALGDVISDGTQLLFVSDRAEEGQYRMYQAQMSDNGWSSPNERFATNVTLQHANLIAVRNETVVFLDPEEQRLKALIAGTDAAQEVDGPDLSEVRHFYVNKYRTRIIFSAPDATGNLDLYETLKLRSTGEWMQPVPISNQINTEFNEDFPFLTEDRSKLFFSSDRAGGVGKYDIYVSEYNEAENAWGAPVNLGMPVNTPDNEFSYRPFKQGQALMSSDRIESLGDMDLFVVAY